MNSHYVAHPLSAGSTILLLVYVQVLRIKAGLYYSLTVPHLPLLLLLNVWLLRTGKNTDLFKYKSWWWGSETYTNTVKIPRVYQPHKYSNFWQIEIKHQSTIYWCSVTI